jgi:hypothetical protein
MLDGAVEVYDVPTPPENSGSRGAAADFSQPVEGDSPTPRAAGLLLLRRARLHSHMAGWDKPLQHGVWGRGRLRWGGIALPVAGYPSCSVRRACE